MKTILRKSLLTLLIASGSSLTFSQVGTQDIDPNLETGAPFVQSRAIFDVEFNIDIGTAGTSGSASLAGVALINNQFWVTQWNTDTLVLLDIDGALIQKFQIPGVLGARSVTWDGTNAYIGTAGSSIFIIDPISKTTTGTIAVTTTSSASARMCTYDPTLDGGNGGFWIGSFSSDIASVSMTGAELSVIPAATHGMTIYGGAVDVYSAGGPYLWGHDQTNSGDFIIQVDLTTGVPTGVSLDYSTVAPTGTITALAGGLFITNEYSQLATTIIGVSQATPSNILFGLELTSSLAVEENNSTTLEVYPNPANDIVNLNTSLNGAIDIQLFDISGKQILSTTTENKTIDVSNYSTGIYYLKISQGDYSSVKKITIK